MVHILKTYRSKSVPKKGFYSPVTRDRGRVRGLLSLQCEKATLPANASRSSNNFPVRTFPNASIYKSRRFAVKEDLHDLVSVWK